MLAPDLGAALRVDPPFPGLRPFEKHESHLFFGRETHVEELLRRLGQNRFLAVVGTSGGGKSSLVKAGLLPDLHRGYLVGATSRWRIASMRPGHDPLAALGQALELPDALGPDGSGGRSRLLRSTTHGLIDVSASAGLAAGEALLVVVDQFEELFRFEAQRPEAASTRALFVSLLLEAVESLRSPVYVILTMRSDFLGDCNRFPGLPEALNRSQYLVPRLTREQRQEAIEGPLRLAGAGIGPGLVQILLNESGEEPDELPVLQHALMRTYAAWRKAGGEGRIDLPHYQNAGRVAQALNDHAEELLHAEGAAGSSLFVERLFRCITTVDDGRPVRRPATLATIFRMAAAETADAQERIRRVVRRFADPDHSLLMLWSASLGDETVIDISHESLIRKWNRLRSWVQAEAKSAEWYRDLLRDIGREAAPWEDPDLARVESLRAQDGWNAAWAEQYTDGRNIGFERVESFLSESRRLVDAEVRRRREEQEREEQRRIRELEAARSLASARLRARRWLSLAVLLLLSLLAAILVFRNREKAAAQNVAALSTELTERRQKEAALASQMDKIQAELDQARDPRQKEELEKRLAGLTAEKEAAVVAAQQAQQQLQNAPKTSDNAALLKQLSDLQNSLRKLQGERDQLQSSYNDVRGERDDLRRQLDVPQVKADVETKTSTPMATQSPRPALDLPRVPSGRPWHQDYRDGAQALNKGEAPLAIAHLREAARSRPRSEASAYVSGEESIAYFPHYYLALAYEKAGDAEAAAREVQLEQEQGVIQKSALAKHFAELRGRLDRRSRK